MDEPSDRRSMLVKHVLVVDDDVEFAQTLGAALVQAGYLARVAFDSDEALAHVKNFTPGVIIVDIMMPVVDGYALLATFRADPSLRDCVFMAISGNSDEAARVKQTFDYFFAKPVTIELLLDAMKTAFE